MTATFTLNGEGLCEVHSWCPVRCADVLAGHLRILADDCWWFVPLAKDGPALSASATRRITEELVRLNKPQMPAPVQQEPKKDLMYSTVAMQERHAAFVDRAVATLEQAKREALAKQPAPTITPEHLIALAQTASLELDKVIKAFQMAAPVSEGRALKLAMAEANDKRLEALRTAAPQPAQKKYRLLEHGDRIESGDTVLDSDSVTWHPLSGWEIGMRWGGNLMPIRRAINADHNIKEQP